MKQPTLHLLLVEDNPDEALLLKVALRQSHSTCTLSIVAGAEEAMNYLRKRNIYADAATPDLVLLDLHLPVRSGKEVLAEIKTDAFLKGIPVIILTNSSQKKDIEECYRLQANSYIVKPSDFDSLLSAVNAIVNFWSDAVRLPVRG